MNYKNLANAEGWGIVAMCGLAAIGIGALILDLILQKFINNKKILNISGAVIIAGITLPILLS